MELRSPAFNPGGTIPAKYTCDGGDVSPPLAWTGVPPAAKSLALIVDDPDAPGRTWVHWVAYDLSAASKGLAEGTAAPTSGVNDFGTTGYGGPCPPSGTHRYYFKLYALSAPPGLPAGATKDQLLKALQGKILGQAELIGRYSRR